MRVNRPAEQVPLGEYWDGYSAKRSGGTATDTALLRSAAKGRVLDVGCGIGKHLAMIRDAGLRVGIDAGYSGLRKGRGAFPSVHFVCGDAYELPLKSEVFDTVIMIDVIEHLEDAVAALKSVARVLRRGGTLFVQTPNYPVKRLYDLWHWMTGSREMVRDDPTHVSRFSGSKLVSALSGAGLPFRLIQGRNIPWESRWRGLGRMKNSPIGRALSQKIIVVAEKQLDV